MDTSDARCFFGALTAATERRLQLSVTVGQERSERSQQDHCVRVMDATKANSALGTDCDTTITSRSLSHIRLHHRAEQLAWAQVAFRIRKLNARVCQTCAPQSLFSLAIVVKT